MDSALRTGPRGRYYGIDFRLTLGCSAVLARFVLDEEAGGSSPLTPTMFFLYIVNTVAVLPMNSPLRSLPVLVGRPL